MPARNSRKFYLENSYYHIYNRGVEKRIIFLDTQDYNVFLRYLEEYLQPKNESELFLRLSEPDIPWQEKEKIRKLLRLNNFFDKITLLAYCLMPNHFHFFIKQTDPNTIDQFMNSLFTRYSMYFNRKYHRVGHLFQGVYKAVLITNENQFIYLSKYIHHQALYDSQGQALRMRQPSSYVDYIDEASTPWVHPEEVLEYFSKTETHLDYQRFVEDSDITGMEEFMDE